MADAQLEGRVLIAGVWWVLELIDDLETDEESSGMTWARTRRIGIDPRGATVRTVIHELMHASEGGLESEVEHDAVAALAAGVASAIMSRPELGRWIAEQAEAGD